MAVTFITPVDVSPTSYGAYVDVDVSAHIAAGATGVILRISNADGASDRKWSVRKNGSTDDLYHDIDASAQTWDFIGVDASRIFEAKLENASIKVELTGYFGSEAVFFTNAVDKSPVGGTGTWQDIDISSDTGSDTAIGIFGVVMATTSDAMGVRKNGSTFSVTSGPDNRQPFICGVDATEIFEFYRSNTSQLIYVVGYMTGGAVFETDWSEIPIASATTWENYSLASGATGAFVFADKNIPDGLYEWGVRKDGTSLAWNADLNHNMAFAAVEAASEVIEGYLENASDALYLVGYTTGAFSVSSPDHSHLSETATFSVLGVDVVSPAAISHADTAAAASFTITRLTQQAQYVLALIARPYDDTLARTITSPPSPFGALPFGAGSSFDATGGEVSIYLSDIGYISKPADVPASQLFEARLASAFNFEVRLFSGSEPEGRSAVGQGDIRILNGDGFLDGKLRYGWDGRSIEIWRGDKTGAFSTFKLLFSGIADGLLWSERDIRIKLRDRQTSFDRPIQSSLYDGSGGLNGNADVKGKRKPQVYGKVLNVEPVNIDPVNLVYQVHDRQMSNVLAVRDAGVALTSAADVSAGVIVSTVVSSGQYVTCIQSGVFKIGTSPSGRITADVEGDAFGSTYVQTAADIVQRIVTSRLLGQNLTNPDDLDTDAFTSTNVDQPSAVGITIGTEPVNVGDVLDEVMTGVGGYWAFTREGKFTLGILNAPSSATSDITYTDADFSARLPLQRTGFRPSWRRSVAYQRLGVTQSADEMAGSVSDEDVAFYSQPYRLADASDSSIRAKHRLALEKESQSNFSDDDNAETESNRLLDIHGTLRDLYEVGINNANFTRWLKDTVMLQTSRFDLSSGKPFIVVGIREIAETGETELELWG